MYTRATPVDCDTCGAQTPHICRLGANKSTCRLGGDQSPADQTCMSNSRMSRPAMMVLPAPGSSASTNRSGVRVGLGRGPVSAFSRFAPYPRSGAPGT